MWCILHRVIFLVMAESQDYGQWHRFLAIQQRASFDSMCYSHKVKSTGFVDYEV